MHPLLLDQLLRLIAAAEREPTGGPNKKLLRHVVSLMVDDIPRDPGHPRYRHGGAIAGAHREWFRGTTGNGRYRLFYRFSTKAQVIVYAWLNDEESLRTRGSRTDAYEVFARMLADGNPPSTWDALMSAAAAPNNTMAEHTSLGGLLRSTD